MQVGFTTVTLRQIKDIEKIVAVAADIGADCIEWGADVHVKDTETAKRAKSLCDAAGISVCSYGSYYRVGSNDMAEWKRVCEIAAAMGAGIVRVWLGNKDSEKTDKATYSALVDEVKAMCAVAAEYGVTVCPECHGNTYNNNTDAFLKMQKDVACDNFRTYFQSRYKRLEYDLDRIERTVKFIDCVHISYSEQVREQFPKLRLLYINVLLDKLKAADYNKSILIEFTYYSMQHGLVGCLKRDIAKLKSKVK